MMSKRVLYTSGEDFPFWDLTSPRLKEYAERHDAELIHLPNGLGTRLGGCFSTHSRHLSRSRGSLMQLGSMLTSLLVVTLARSGNTGDSWSANHTHRKGFIRNGLARSATESGAFQTNGPTPLRRSFRGLRINEC